VRQAHGSLACADDLAGLGQGVDDDTIGIGQQQRIAGRVACDIGCWMEGAVTSSLDAIKRLHKRALEA